MSATVSVEAHLIYLRCLKARPPSLELKNLINVMLNTLSSFYRASLRTADVSPCSSPLSDVSRGGTSITERQKFHTDDAKSVRNPVRSADWSTESFHCSSYCLRMTDKRQKEAKVKCKRAESPTKQSIFVEHSLL